MMLRHCSLRIDCYVHKGRLWQFNGCGNTQFADFVKSLISYSNSIDVDKVAYDNGSSLIIPRVDLTQKLVIKFLVNVLHLLDFIFIFSIVIIIFL
jgi:hypothetical protein